MLDHRRLNAQQDEDVAACKMKARLPRYGVVNSAPMSGMVVKARLGLEEDAPPTYDSLSVKSWRNAMST